MKVDMLENINEICELRLLYGVEIWGVDGGWEIVEGGIGEIL
jgi:hypothetical protein